GRPEMHVWELTMGRRVAPPVRLGSGGGSLGRTLAVTPDGRRALVGLAGQFPAVGLAVVDLEAILSPCRTPAADLALLAELATARHIELGDLSGLTTEQLLARWALLRERGLDPARPFVIDRKPARK